MKTLDPHICWTALESKDARFDGRFFTGVKTTGIYCRPVCPAPLPRRQHVEYYRCAAAAEAAGFRPCLRCRPEASPGTPAWNGHSEVISRALQLIASGTLKEGGVENLAGQLNLSTRQLRRLFMDQLGATPIAVAQTYRVQFAKQLITETGLPMSEIAFTAGFSSIRRFNSAMQKAYKMNPSELRRTKKEPTGKASVLELNLSYRPPYNWDAMMDFLSVRAIPGIDLVNKKGYRRTVSIDNVSGVIEVQPMPEKNFVKLRVPLHLAHGLQQIVEKIRNLFDLRAEPENISHTLSVDPLLASIIKKHPGIRVPGAWAEFEIAVRAILGQQVSVKAASTLAARLVEQHGQPIESDVPELNRLFPKPEQLAEADLTKIGVTSKRAETIHNLSRAVAEGEIDFSVGWSLEQTVKRWTELPGIGPWTAHYIAMRGLGEPDAFPAEDLVLQQVVGDGQRLTPGQLRERAEKWQPWRAYATIVLWRHATDLQNERK